VKRVNTAIYLGKEKKNVFTGRVYKLSDWKKAIVTIEQEPGKAPGTTQHWRSRTTLTNGPTHRWQR